MSTHDDPGYASTDDSGDPMGAAASEPPIVIPMDALSPEALAGVIEAFILREGTDYGLHETPFSDKVRQVRRQLETGDARILFDPVNETVHIALALQSAQRPRAAFRLTPPRSASPDAPPESLPPHQAAIER